MPTLHVDSSPLYGWSVSSELTLAFVTQWKPSHPDGRVVDRDLDATAMPPITAEWVGTVYTIKIPQSSADCDLMGHLALVAILPVLPAGAAPRWSEGRSEPRDQARAQRNPPSCMFVKWTRRLCRYPLTTASMPGWNYAAQSFRTSRPTHDNSVTPLNLYHSSSLAGICGILKSHVIWASDVRSMSDTSDGQYWLDVFRSVIGRNSVPPWVREWLEQTDAFGLGTHWDTYISCFCGGRQPASSMGSLP
jgi:hypothetical protein